MQKVKTHYKNDRDIFLNIFSTFVGMKGSPVSQIATVPRRENDKRKKYSRANMVPSSIKLPSIVRALILTAGLESCFSPQDFKSFPTLPQKMYKKR